MLCDAWIQDEFNALPRTSSLFAKGQNGHTAHRWSLPCQIRSSIEYRERAFFLSHMQPSLVDELRQNNYWVLDTLYQVIWLKICFQLEESSELLSLGARSQTCKTDDASLAQQWKQSVKMMEVKRSHLVNRDLVILTLSSSKPGGKRHVPGRVSGKAKEDKANFSNHTQQAAINSDSLSMLRMQKVIGNNSAQCMRKAMACWLLIANPCLGQTFLSGVIKNTYLHKKVQITEDFGNRGRGKNPGVMLTDPFSSCKLAKAKNTEEKLLPIWSERS